MLTPLRNCILRSHSKRVTDISWADAEPVRARESDVTGSRIRPARDERVLEIGIPLLKPEVAIDGS